MALFLGQGMVAWMLTCSWVVTATNPDHSRPCPSPAVTVADGLRGEIVLVLAAMALKQAPEVYR
jgi:hypothetical protein